LAVRSAGETAAGQVAWRTVRIAGSILDRTCRRRRGGGCRVPGISRFRFWERR